MGEHGSELPLAAPGRTTVTARVAARLDEHEHPEIKNLKFDQQPYWDLERARIGSTRSVPLEVIVNGYPAAKRTIEADGRPQDVSFEIPIEQLGGAADFALLPHQPDLRHGRRAADPRLQAQR
jgi:hypothetical protein